MANFKDWCDADHHDVGRHALHILSGNPKKLKLGIDAAAAIVPTHYTSDEQVARVLERLGKPAAAEFVRNKLPTAKSIKSGDLGEIITTEYISAETPYIVPIRRLRWKDHRNMAMRGEDVIGIVQDSTPPHRLRFLKSEAKSRITLSSMVVAEARSGLDKDGGLPSAHALSFISSRLFEIGNNALADAIDRAQLQIGIPASTVTHFLFTFSGNSPTLHLRTSLANYTGTISQMSVGIQVTAHGDFVSAVYDLVMVNGNDN